MSEFGRKNLDALMHAPQRHVRNLAAFAGRLLDRIEALERQLRDEQEARAACELAKDYPPVVVVVDHTGHVEVRSAVYVPVHIAEVHDMGDAIASEDRARGRVPWRYRGAFDAKAIAAGGPAIDKYKLAYIEGERLLYRALSECAPAESRKALSANGDATPDAAKAKAQHTNVAEGPGSAAAR